jgi:flagellar hook protein FlgE
LNTRPATPGASNSPLSFIPGGSANPVPTNVVAAYNALSQYAGGFNLGDIQQDGYAAGDLLDKTINAAGIIVGMYSNGQQLNLGQIATCIFNNQQGLERAGSTLFTKSNNSGPANIGTAGEGGRGSLQAGVLEMANVDLAEEFTNMIVTQRGFQSNSRTITTSDEMLQELINLKR